MYILYTSITVHFGANPFTCQRNGGERKKVLRILNFGLSWVFWSDGAVSVAVKELMKHTDNSHLYPCSHRSPSGGDSVVLGIVPAPCPSCHLQGSRSPTAPLQRQLGVKANLTNE